MSRDHDILLLYAAVQKTRTTDVKLSLRLRDSNLSNHYEEVGSTKVENLKFVGATQSVYVYISPSYLSTKNHRATHYVQYIHKSEIIQFFEFPLRADQLELTTR